MYRKTPTKTNDVSQLAQHRRGSSRWISSLRRNAEKNKSRSVPDKSYARKKERPTIQRIYSPADGRSSNIRQMQKTRDLLRSDVARQTQGIMSRKQDAKTIREYIQFLRRRLESSIDDNLCGSSGENAKPVKTRDSVTPELSSTLRRAISYKKDGASKIHHAKPVQQQQIKSFDSHGRELPGVKAEKMAREYSDKATAKLSSPHHEAPADACEIEGSELGRLLGLEKCGLEKSLDVLRRFVNGAESAFLTRSQLFTFFNRIADVEPSNYVTISQLYEALETRDVRGHGRVSFRDLASGLTILCAANADAKARAAFSLFARSDDGGRTLYVTNGGVETYLAAMYKVVFFMTDADVERNTKKTPQRLARATASLICGHGGRLSLEQFVSALASPLSLSPPPPPPPPLPSSSSSSSSNSPLASPSSIRVKRSKTGSIFVDVGDDRSSLSPINEMPTEASIMDICANFHRYLKIQYRNISALFRRNDTRSQRLTRRIFERAIGELAEADSSFPLSGSHIHRFCGAVALGKDAKIGMTEVYATIYKHRVNVTTAATTYDGGTRARVSARGSIFLPPRTKGLEMRDPRIRVNARGSVFINRSPGEGARI